MARRAAGEGTERRARARSAGASSWLRGAALLGAASLAGAGVGCGGPAPAEILQLTELNPRQVEIGDRVELAGRDLPPPTDIRRIALTFRGSLSRPGRGACRTPVEVTVSDPPVGAVVTDGATGGTREQTYAESAMRTLRIVGSNRLEFVMTEALLQRLTECPDQRDGAAVTVPHATLALGAGASGALGARGTSYGVTVRIDGLSGERSLSGTLRGPVLDLLAPPARRVALEAPARAPAERALDFLGLELAASHPAEGGLRIAAVRAGSPAEQAGLLSNDVLVAVDGLTVLSVADALPTARARGLTVGILRNEVREERYVSLEGFVAVAPVDLIASAVLLAVAATMLALLLAPRPAAIGWLAHRASKLLRRRGASASPAAFARAALGATRAALGGRFPTPERAAVGAAPYLLLAAAVSFALVVPAAPSLLRSSADLWALYALAAAARLAYALLRGATEPGPFAPRAFFRAVLQGAPVALAAVVSLAGPVVLAGTLRTEGIVAAQGGAPPSWFLVRTPASLVLGALFCLVLLASGDAAVEARAASAAGDGPLRSAAVRATLAGLDWLGVLLASAVFSAAFLGGWQLPGVTFAEQDGSVFLQMLGAVGWVARAWCCVFAVLYARWALPDLRVAPLFARGLRALAPMALGCLGLTVAWALAAPSLSSATTDAVAAYTLALLALLTGGALLRALRASAGIAGLLTSVAAGTSSAGLRASASAGSSAGLARRSLGASHLGRRGPLP